jgi:thiol-disulfide isomerase/thioredoxin
MPSIINQYSAVLALTLLLAVLALVAWDYRRRRRVVVALVLVGVLLVAGYASARHGPSSVASAAEAEALIGGGTPVVLEVYSDSCTLCLISRRGVDALERELAGEAVVLRVNLYDEVGRAITARYGARSLPTFIVFDAGGAERFRSTGLPDFERLETEALAGR